MPSALEVDRMPHYLVQAAYTPDALAAMTKNPSNRVDVLKGVMQGMGGQIESAYFSFGEYDIVAIMELPDNVSAAAFAIGSASKGHLKAMKTTPLLTMDEGLQAMAKGGSLDLVAPG
jgi:uncharacterized protein with GYD domain